MKPYGFIYLTTNNINNKKYIGQRKIQGNSTDDTYIGSGVALLEAIRKYGRENFTREILAYGNTEDELNQLEEYYIALHNATERNDYYNIHAGGKSGNKFAGWSEERLNEFRQRMSKKYTGQNNPRYGVPCSEETKERIRQARLNSSATTFQSKEFLEKMSRVTSGENNGMYGRRHSEESRRRMSENSKGITAGEKNGMYGKRGESAINGKPVYKYHDESHTKLAKEYVSVRCVLDDLGLKGHVGLYKAIKNNQKYKGYYWSRTKTCND